MGFGGLTLPMMKYFFYPALFVALAGCSEDTSRFDVDAGATPMDTGTTRDVSSARDRPDLGTPEVLDLTDVPITQDAPAQPCMNALAAPVLMYYEGGLTQYSDRYTFSPPRAFRAERRSGTAVTAMCETELPTCETRDMVTVSDLANMLDQADVRMALASSTAAMPTLYGFDSRPADGQVLVIEQGMGRVLVGEPCRQAPGTQCVNIPLGFQRLIDVFRALRDQELLRTTCMALRP